MTRTLLTAAVALTLFAAAADAAPRGAKRPAPRVKVVKRGPVKKVPVEPIPVVKTPLPKKPTVAVGPAKIVAPVKLVVVPKAVPAAKSVVKPTTIIQPQLAPSRVGWVPLNRIRPFSWAGWLWTIPVAVEVVVTQERVEVDE